MNMFKITIISEEALQQLIKYILGIFHCKDENSIISIFKSYQNIKRPLGQ